MERFHRLTEWLDAGLNQLFAPIAYVLLWTFHCSAFIEKWRAVNGPMIRDWIDASGQYEGISALATLAFDNLESCWPDILSGPPRLSAASIAHPLLPRSSRVANDVEIGNPSRLLIVSGSNMSGKSTLMRTIGVNTVLALAGGPAIAMSMAITPLQVGASIRTQDSLQDGVSRFYAEITRIRQIVGLTDGPLPVLFLLDEILHGTNSHDRQIGAEAIARSLVAASAVGLVTTHDLALARLADDLALNATNVHFEDQVTDGRVEFDYRLKEGVVRKSNAIALMRAVGLDV
jgi:DNA mismatch repair ATPase MutS